ncbi:hypothetical protein OE88DRAFT_430827 [Heliocybe sulcata]|uniref:Uncharacterized protein n=1 Tax=Heliocybe sulcata TaxID=5364 RepID=A0A5C3MWD2_9AGAM|nr:hypothetical protein OE88DRAFT_430827 [Heliocybe sulcata]
MNSSILSSALYRIDLFCSVKLIWNLSMSMCNPWRTEWPSEPPPRQPRDCISVYRAFRHSGCDLSWVSLYRVRMSRAQVSFSTAAGGKIRNLKISTRGPKYSKSGSCTSVHRRTQWRRRNPGCRARGIAGASGSQWLSSGMPRPAGVHRKSTTFIFLRVAITWGSCTPYSYCTSCIAVLIL